VEIFTLYFDGSCWPNPGGTAATGYALYLGSELVTAKHHVLGTGPFMSNNVAEYSALNNGLEAFIRHEKKGYSTLNVYGDSQLVINQMSGKWKIKSGLYRFYAIKAKTLCNEIRKSALLEFEWIPREQNIEADSLSKAHLTEYEKQTSR
jgi:ribonuclease HI